MTGELDSAAQWEQSGKRKAWPSCATKPRMCPCVLPCTLRTSAQVAAPLHVSQAPDAGVHGCALAHRCLKARGGAGAVRHAQGSVGLPELHSVTLATHKEGITWLKVASHKISKVTCPYTSLCLGAQDEPLRRPTSASRPSNYARN
jgi:hypothetical protein